MSEELPLSEKLLLHYSDDKAKIFYERLYDI